MLAPTRWRVRSPLSAVVAIVAPALALTAVMTDRVRLRAKPRPQPSRVVLGLAGQTYRPALDGIRAVAVTAVVLYHVGWLPGGYLGVDFFFVLSGYLITGLLLTEFARSGRVSFSTFWTRRARRLYPAVLLLVTVYLVELHRIVSERATLHERRGDIVATLFYYANWHFIATDQSYFASFTSGVSPLRHMWSLAIEEQFYLAWPLLLVALLFLSRGRKRVIVLAIAAATAVSVAMMAHLYAPGDASRAYFGTDSRAHALLIGAALAVLTANRTLPLHWRRWIGWVGATAVVVLAAALVWLDDGLSAYYHGGSLAIAVAVALGIWAVESNPELRLARVLSTRALTWTGRISYSIYLWHWPLIIWTTSFITIASVTAQKLLAIALTVAAATFSYFAVEAPVRFGRIPWLRTSKRRLAVVLPVLVVVLLLGTWHVTKPVFTNDSSVPCPPGSPSVGDHRWCVRVDPSLKDPPVIVTVGDSTVRALDPGLTHLALAHTWRYIDAGQDGCSVIPVVVVVNCTPETQLLATIQRQQHPNLWILSDAFSLNPVRAPDGSIVPGSDPRHDAILGAATGAVVRQLTDQGAKVILVPTPPEGPQPNCGTRVVGAACGGDVHSIRDPEHERLARIYAGIADSMKGRVAAVPIADLLCTSNGQCPAVVGGELARVDGVHYTASFSAKLVPIIFARAQQLGVTA